MKKYRLISGSLIVTAFLTLMIAVLWGNVSVPISAVKSLLSGTSLLQVCKGFEEQFNSSFPNKTMFVDINGLSHKLFAQQK